MKNITYAGLVIFALLLTKPVLAEESVIAHFKSPQGKTYYANTGLVSKKDAGWKNDGIEGGITEIVVNNGKLDVRYVDATKRIMSAREDGGEVKIFGRGINAVSIWVYYPRHTIEVYNFYKDEDGQTKYIYTSTRSGEDLPIIKSSVYVGSCDFVYFDKFSE
jgi:hypothetical protein